MVIFTLTQMRIINFDGLPKINLVLAKRIRFPEQFILKDLHLYEKGGVSLIFDQ